jgi:hypothetical protein
MHKEEGQQLGMNFHFQWRDNELINLGTTIHTEMSFWKITPQSRRSHYKEEDISLYFFDSMNKGWWKEWLQIFYHTISFFFFCGFVFLYMQTFEFMYSLLLDFLNPKM